MNTSIFLQRKERRGEISETERARLTGFIWRGPFGQTGLGFSARVELHPGLKKSHVIEKKFQPELQSRIQYGCLILPRLFARNFIFGAEANISARAEVRHVVQRHFSLVSRAEIRHVIRPQQCCDLLRLNVAIVWPELANAGTTLLSFGRGLRAVKIVKGA